MREFPITPVEMLLSIWRHRELIKIFAMREIQARYRGSLLGIMWAFFNPMLMLLVFTFVFSVIFQARWGGESESKLEFALVLFIGLIVFNLFAENITNAPKIILSNVNYVKKIIFPLEILPVAILFSTLFHFFIGLVVWLIGYLIFFGMPSPTIFLLPLLVLPFCFFIVGLNWILASIGVFMRDISQLIGTLVTALMFLSPIFYPVTAFPENYRFILYLNPLTTVVEEARNILYWGKSPHLSLLGIYFVVTFCIAWIGFIWFQKTRKGFADVL